MVRAKFHVQKVEKTLYGYAPDQKEMTTLTLAPVYSNDPESENKKFWDATPSGKLELGVILPGAAEYFELGQEYYLDFTKVEKAIDPKP